MKKPNIVFILTDDQGYGDLGCHGNKIIQTPNIDDFYKNAVRLTDFHVGPTCAPTRAGLMTGHYANSTGVWHTIGGRSLLRKDEWSLANALQEAGYKTGLFGKWHLGDEYPYRPQDRGFDEVIMHGGGGISQTPDFWGNDYFDDTYKVNGEYRKFNGYCTDVFFEEGIKFIEENKDEPFMCFIPTNAPHCPYNVEKKYSEMYEDKVPSPMDRFYGMITNIDENFGKLRNVLKALELEENTILIYMTDNGTSAGANFSSPTELKDGYNAGMRGTKCSPYEGGHRVPFLIHWPSGNIMGGRDIDSLTANVDFMPTLLDLCGIDVPRERSFHGMSLAPYLRGESSDSEDRVIVTDSQRVPTPVKWKDSAVMKNKWRLINGKELYDLSNDIGQKYDISEEHPNVVSDLKSEYERWWDLVTPKIEDDIPLYIKGDRETVLNTHDWRNEDCSCAWNQQMVRQGILCNGYYEIYVEEDGLYEVSLRRWPSETNHGITSAISSANDIEWFRDGVGEDDYSWYSGSTALSIENAKLQINGNEWTKTLDVNEQEVTFEVPINRGNGRLQTTFTGPEIELGAYYVVIRPIEEQSNET